MTNWNKEPSGKLFEEITESLRQRRLQMNISQRELAKLSHVSLPLIARLESGVGNITLINLISVMKALNMADSLAVAFRISMESPRQIEKAERKKPQRRVRRSHPNSDSEETPWRWEEDKG